jgi:hypothetical protein
VPVLSTKGVAMNIGETVEKIIQNKVKEICSATKVPDLPENVVETDSIGEVIEKLVILHIRMWMIEDQLGIVKTDNEIADLKKKSDICFKIKRPKYVEALNQMINNSVIKGKTLQEDSVKLYKGVVNE